MEKLELRIPKPGEWALAGRDALAPEHAPPFVLVGLVLALLTNVLTAAAATVAYAYVTALWNRARTNGS